MQKENILVVFGYHPKETFAVEVGESLSKKNKNPNIHIVPYTGKKDKGLSSYQLRSFVEGLDSPNFSVKFPIVLHDDYESLNSSGHGICNAAVIFRSKTKEELKQHGKLLRNFVLDCNKPESSNILVPGRFLTFNTKYSWIDVELNPKISVSKAETIVNNLAEYLLKSHNSTQKDKRR